MWLGRAADHSTPSSAEVMKEQIYTSTYSLGHTGPVTGSLYLFIHISTQIYHEYATIQCFGMTYTIYERIIHSNWGTP